MIILKSSMNWYLDQKMKENIIQHLDEWWNSWRRKSTNHDVDKYFEDNKILITKGEQGKKYNGYYGRRLQPSDMSTLKC